MGEEDALSHFDSGVRGRAGGGGGSRTGAETTWNQRHPAFTVSPSARLGTPPPDSFGPGRPVAAIRSQPVRLLG